jgi:hypothetical protein
MNEICLCAALLMPDDYIVRGHRHDDCLITAGCFKRYDKQALHQAKQGFLTTSGRFVDRYEGMTLMKATDRVSAWTRLPFTLASDMLFSEDLY